MDKKYQSVQTTLFTHLKHKYNAKNTDTTTGSRNNLLFDCEINGIRYLISVTKALIDSRGSGSLYSDIKSWLDEYQWPTDSRKINIGINGISEGEILPDIEG